MAFDLASVLKNDVSNLDTETIERIDIDLIDPDENNFYLLSGLDELAANIELCGLMDPIRVRPTEGGRYTVISGHRRRAAIIMIRDGGSDQFAAGVPCIVERGELSPEMLELRLIYANANTRRISDAELGKQAERVTELLYKLKEQGIEFPGRMRDHVAQACQVSASKIARLKLITEGLGPELRPLWDDGNLTESLALELVKCPEDLKTRIVKAYRRNLKSIRPSFVSDVAERWKAGEHYEGCQPPERPKQCSECSHGNGALKHDLEESLCGRDCFDKCCLKCDRGGKCPTGGWPCQYMCSKAAEKRKTVKAKENQKAEDERKAQNSKEEARVMETAQRLLRAADGAGLDDKDKIEIGYSSYSYPGISLIRKYANGDFSGNYVYRDTLSLTSIMDVKKLCQHLRCSADYLFGLTDDLNPVSKSDTAADWITDRDPEESGDYILWYGNNYREVCWYDAAQKVWKMWSSDNEHILTVHGWYPLPKFPEA